MQFSLERISKNLFCPPSVVMAGLILAFIAMTIYVQRGYLPAVIIIWLVSLAMIVVPMAKYRVLGRSIQQFERADVIALSGLAIFVSPFYLCNLYDVPCRPMPEEPLWINLVAFQFDQVCPDPLGISHYNCEPGWMFVCYKWLATLFGPITLEGTRAPHAVLGLLTVVVAYLLYRQVAPRIVAFGATLLLALSHTFLHFSRLAGFEQYATLIEAVAFFVFLRATNLRCPYLAFIGGMIAGYGWYHLMATRIAIFIWMAFIFLRQKVCTPIPNSQWLWRLVVPSILGFLLAVTPICIAILKSPNEGTNKTTTRLMLNPAARAFMQVHNQAATEQDAVVDSMLSGLGVFNNGHTDYWGNYWNPGHGIVDPLTGVWLWIGVGFVIWRLRSRPPTQDLDLMMLINFLLGWLSLALFFTGAPAYNRYLSVFVALEYFCMWGIILVSTWIAKLFKRQQEAGWNPQQLATALLVYATIAANGLIVADYLLKQRAGPIGDAMRYMDRLRQLPGYRYYVVHGVGYEFNAYVGCAEYRRLLSANLGKDQELHVICLDGQEGVGEAGFIAALPAPPFTVFLHGKLWEKYQDAFKKKYPHFRLHHFLELDDYLAIEVID